MLTTEQIKTLFGASNRANFEVVDTIGVPHTYTIGSRHVKHASKHHNGLLGEETLKAVQCAHRGCRLSYKDHEKALLVECRAEMKDADGKAVPELHHYLLACKEKAEANGFVGFAFLDKVPRENAQ